MTITQDHNQSGHKLCLSASVQEQVKICFEEVYDGVKWDKVFRFCQKKLRNTDSNSLFPLLAMASAE